jgi:hypothetical protein
MRPLALDTNTEVGFKRSEATCAGQAILQAR